MGRRTLRDESMCGGKLGMFWVVGVCVRYKVFEEE